MTYFHAQNVWGFKRKNVRICRVYSIFFYFVSHLPLLCFYSIFSAPCGLAFLESQWRQCTLDAPISIIMRADQCRSSNSTHVHHLIWVYIHMQSFSQKKKKKKMQPRLFCFLLFFFSVPVNNKLVVMFVIFTHWNKLFINHVHLNTNCSSSPKRKHNWINS